MTGSKPKSSPQKQREADGRHLHLGKSRSFSEMRYRQSSNGGQKRKQDFELGRIQVETKQIELDREKALILDRQEVELWAATALIELREGIMQLPEMLAASAPQELKDFTREESDRHCRDLLLSTARRLELSEIGKVRAEE